MKTQLLHKTIGSSVKSKSGDLLLQELIKAQNSLRVRAQNKPDIAYIKVSI